MVRSHVPYMVFLIETKQKNHSMNQFCTSCGFNNNFHVERIGTACGLSIWWNDDVLVQVLSSTTNVIDSVLQWNTDQKNCRITWMYGTPYSEEKPAFWNKVYSMSRDMDGSWLVCGDFNEKLWPHEKLGGRGWSDSRVRFLRIFMEKNFLVDLRFAR